jgi:hypothetical protein
MTPTDYDVYLCCRDPSRHGLAQVVSAGLTQRGFRVFVGDRVPGSSPDEPRLQLIGNSTDFVILSTASTSEARGHDPDPLRAEIAHAFNTRRHIVVVSEPGHQDPLTDGRSPALPRLSDWQRITHDPTRSRETVALLAHRLLSSSEVEDRRLMRTARQATLAVGFIFAAVIASFAVPALVAIWNRPAPKPPLPPFTVYWSAFGQRFGDGRWAEFPLSDGSQVVSGDQVRIVFSPSADGFAYVVSQDRRGGISVLYPTYTMSGASHVRAGGVYGIPAGSNWITIDDQPGLDTIYLLAGYDPLENVEELVDESTVDASPQARRELVLSTVAGLIDGRHAAVRPPIRTRYGNTILSNLPVSRGPLACSAILGNGTVVQRPCAAQQGLVSAVVELRVRHEQAP